MLLRSVLAVELFLFGAGMIKVEMLMFEPQTMEWQMVSGGCCGVEMAA